MAVISQMSPNVNLMYTQVQNNLYEEVFNTHIIHPCSKYKLAIKNIRLEFIHCSKYRQISSIPFTLAPKM